MDTLEMHRTPTDVGVPPRQADAFVKVPRGGVATRQDLEILEKRLTSRIDKAEAGLRTRINQAEARLDRRIDQVEAKIDKLATVMQPMFGAVLLGVLAPLIVRLVPG